MNKKQQGLTLIEIMTVVVVVGIIATFVVYNFNNANEQKRVLEILSFSEGLEGKNLNSLVSKWSFDGPTQAGYLATAEDVRDEAGYNNGNVSGHAPIVKEGEDCLLGKCLLFDGTSAYIEIGDPIPYDLRGEAFTVSMWIRPINFSAEIQGVLGAEWRSTNAGYSVSIDNRNPSENGGVSNGINFYIGSGSGEWESSIQGTTAEALALDEWSNVVAIAEEGSVYRVYLNGKLVTNWTAGSIIFYDNNCQFDIGRNNLGYFNGYIDEVSFFNKALTISEIEENYNLGKNGNF